MQAFLKVTLIDNKGQEHSAVRIVEDYRTRINATITEWTEKKDLVENDAY